MGQQQQPPQPHLNGAFYGPSIPPPVKSSYRPGSRGGGGGIFSCCCGCIFNCIFNCIYQTILFFVILIGIILFVFWLIFRPNPVKFNVTDASLTQFEFSSNNTLHYNLSLNLTVRNPNKRIGIYYDSIDARAFYLGQQFGSSNLTRFYQGHKRTDVVNPVFKGQNMVVLGDKELGKFNAEKSGGNYSIVMKVYIKARFKLFLFKTPKFKPMIECDLKVPLDSSGKGAADFETKKCDFDWRR